MNTEYPIDAQAHLTAGVPLAPSFDGSEDGRSERFDTLSCLARAKHDFRLDPVFFEQFSGLFPSKLSKFAVRAVDFRDGDDRTFDAE